MEVGQLGRPEGVVIDCMEIPRFGVAETLRGSGRFCRVTEASDPSETICHQPSALMIYVLRPSGRCSFEHLERLSTLRRDARVLVVAVQDERLVAARALSLGARGVINLDVSREALLSAVERVLAGEFYLSPATMQMLFQSSQDGSHRDPVDSLTSRELDIFRLLGQGMTAKEIARKVHLSPKTVEYHRQRIKEKLLISTTADLIRYATMRVLQPLEGASAPAPPSGARRIAG